MPFIDMQLSKKLDYAEKQKLQAVATDIVAQAMGKPAGAVMVSVHDACDLYMGGEVLISGLYMEIRAFGPSESSVKEAMTMELNKAIKSLLQISEQHIYITFEDKMQWGFKGGYLEK